MPNDFNLATPLASNPNMIAFVEVVREELERLDYTRLFFGLFETVDESLLDILAEQFDMLGYNGWILADTVQAKRELLKSAYELHMLKGTPAGIREVIKRLGFADATIEEGWENFSVSLPEPAYNPWAHFRVVISIPPEKALNEQIATQLHGLINTYKNARSILAEVAFSLDQSEKLEFSDELNIVTP